MRRETKPGEVMEVDFGYLRLTWDAAVRARKRTWVFSMAEMSAATNAMVAGTTTS